MTLHHSIGRDPLEALIKGETLPDLLMARLLDPIYVSPISPSPSTATECLCADFWR